MVNNKLSRNHRKDAITATIDHTLNDNLKELHRKKVLEALKNKKDTPRFSNTIEKILELGYSAIEK